MYLYHYGLNQLPFTITPNTQFYCELKSHDQAAKVVLTALNTGEGFIKVTGEVGTGKTLLCRRLLEEIPDYFYTAYVPDSYLNPDQLRRAVAQELGVETADIESEHPLARALQDKLLEINHAGRAVVLIVDEAQALPEDSLEALRLLSNLETESRKLLHIILVGQPELDERLAQHNFRQLRQRISFSHRLTAMNVRETAQYIGHRMRIAGYKGEPIFSAGLVSALYESSRGIPRLVNVLAHKMLLLAYGEGRRKLSHKDLRLATKDTSDTRYRSPMVRLIIWSILLVCVAVSAIVSLTFEHPAWPWNSVA